MAELTIRPFAWADVPAITAIYAHYVTQTVITFETEPPAEAAMADGSARWWTLATLLLTAEADGAIVGYAYASFFRPRAAYRFYLRGLDLSAPGHRGARSWQPAPRPADRRLRRPLVSPR